MPTLKLSLSVLQSAHFDASSERFIFMSMHSTQFISLVVLRILDQVLASAP
jgi:hypothetical protein